MRGVKKLCFPSHTLYAGDILIFCKGTKANFKALFSIFASYVRASGQVFSSSQSSLFAGGMGEARFNNLLVQYGFYKGSLHFVYLDEPIFKDRPKFQFFQPIIDKILMKLSTCKGSLLSVA